MRKKNTQNIKDVIMEIIREQRLDNGLTETRVIKLWGELLGPHVARSTRNVYLKNGILYVHLNSSVIRNELFMIRDKIVASINKEIGEKAVRSISFH